MSTTPLWLIQNVHLPKREGLWQIAIDKGRFGDITPMGEARSESYEVLNARGGLAIPPFIEPHIHLDTTQTAGEPNWNQSGTLFEGIERWAERKALLSHEDVKARAWKTLRWQIANGIQFVRTHVDVSDPTLTALKAMLEVKQEVAPWVDLQIVAFPQRGFYPTPMVRVCWRRRYGWAPMWLGRSRISNLPVNMVWNHCISLSVWRRNTSVRWISTAMKLTMNSRALSKRSPRWH